MSTVRSLGIQTALEGGGAPAGCSALDARHCLVVARPDAISVYTRDARGPVFVFPGESRSVGRPQQGGCDHPEALHRDVAKYS